MQHYVSYRSSTAYLNAILAEAVHAAIVTSANLTNQRMVTPSASPSPGPSTKRFAEVGPTTLNVAIVRDFNPNLTTLMPQSDSTAHLRLFLQDLLLIEEIQQPTSVNPGSFGTSRVSPCEVAIHTFTSGSVAAITIMISHLASNGPEQAGAGNCASAVEHVQAQKIPRTSRPDKIYYS